MAADTLHRREPDRGQAAPLTITPLTCPDEFSAPTGNLLASDAYDLTDHVLIEAKGTVSRENVHMAIGQLLDYRRFDTPRPRCRILLPSCPSSNLLELLRELSIEVAYPAGETFRLITA